MGKQLSDTPANMNLCSSKRDEMRANSWRDGSLRRVSTALAKRIKKMMNDKTILLRVNKETHLAVKLAAAMQDVNVNVMMHKIINEKFANELAQARMMLAEEKSQ